MSVSTALAGGRLSRAAVAAVDASRPLATAGTRPEFLGRVADGIGLGYVSADGRQHVAGDAHAPFSLQSITKLFALALLLRHDGDEVWRDVGYGPSDRPYYAFGELDTSGRPANPFVNAGALVITDRLQALTGDAAEAVRAFVAQQSGNAAVRIDASVAAAELARSHRNTALAHALAAADRLTQSPAVVVEQYVRQCAITASCVSTARAALFAAQHGRGYDDEPVLDATTTRRLNGLLTIAGTYAASARTLFRIGLPAKSGVGGGILALVPGRGVACAWSPGLDAEGNSIGAARALEIFVDRAAIHEG